jgi:hypothetical protein
VDFLLRQLELRVGQDPEEFIQHDVFDRPGAIPGGIRGACFALAPMPDPVHLRLKTGRAQIAAPVRRRSRPLCLTGKLDTSPKSKIASTSQQGSFDLLCVHSPEGDHNDLK